MLSIARKRLSIERQIDEWEEVAFNAEVAHRVHARLKADAATLKQFVDRMTNAEIAITDLREQLAALDADAASA